jgi:hypothetical protein
MKELQFEKARRERERKTVGFTSTQGSKTASRREKERIG